LILAISFLTNLAANPGLTRPVESILAPSECARELCIQRGGGFPAEIRRDCGRIGHGTCWKTIPSFRSRPRSRLPSRCARRRASAGHGPCAGESENHVGSRQEWHGKGDGNEIRKGLARCLLEENTGLVFGGEEVPSATKATEGFVMEKRRHEGDDTTLGCQVGGHCAGTSEVLTLPPSRGRNTDFAVFWRFQGRVRSI
jgi:hypothetical protein